MSCERPEREIYFPDEDLSQEFSSSQHEYEVPASPSTESSADVNINGNSISGMQVVGDDEVDDCPDSDDIHDELSIDIDEFSSHAASRLTEQLSNERSISGGENESDLNSSSTCDRKEVENKVRNGCCSANCLKNFDVDEITAIKLSILDCNREVKDAMIMGKLLVLGFDPKSCNDDDPDAAKKRIRHKYAYDDREVCKEAFLFLHNIT